MTTLIRKLWHAPALGVFLLLAVAGVVAPLVVLALTDEPSTCFGGALSEDPISCVVLERADREGVIDVDAVYGNGNALEIYLTQAEYVSNEQYDSIREMARAEVLRMGEETGEYACDYTPRGCSYDGRGRGMLRKILPVSEVYGDIYLHPGGREARKSLGGWASFVQLWPEPDGDEDATTFSDSDDGSFDISDVDTTNFPDMTCKYGNGAGHLEGACGWAVGRFGGMGLAGKTGGGFRGSTYYVQVKATDADAAEAEAAREAILGRYPKITPDRLVIVPVKYDYEELWRWATVLYRFSRSAGNTVGIKSVSVAENRVNLDTRNSNGVYPTPPGLSYVNRDRYPDAVRTTIAVWTWNFQDTVDALPRLLAQLNIPADAVGVVLERVSIPYADGIPETGQAP